MSWAKRIFKPLKSRKFRVALATVIAGVAVEYGLDLSGEAVLLILGVGASLILGIAHEDHGEKSAKVHTGFVQRGNQN